MQEIVKTFIWSNLKHQFVKLRVSSYGLIVKFLKIAFPQNVKMLKLHADY